MTGHSDDTDRKQCTAFVDQILNEAAGSRATAILFRMEVERVQTFFMIDGKFEKSLAIPKTYWDLVKYILRSDYFDTGQYQLPYQGALCVFLWTEDDTGAIKLPITRKAIPGRRLDRIEDIFQQFEDRTWDAVKSIFLSILNLALEQGYDGVHMELDGPVVEISYYLEEEQKTGMTISSDSYDALARLIGENYLAFGFMTRNFREKEFLVRLKELNENDVAPRIRLEIEQLD
ncbi:MAG: hypothetical protein ABIG42_05530 [bacterium]